MATRNQLSYGSSGAEVKELQTLLNNNGYNLDVDGSFGPATLEAVKAYQKANGLDVDGYVGPLTWGALTATPTNTTTSADTTNGTATTTSTTPTVEEWTYDDFEVSDSTKSADEKRQNLESQKPGDFTYNDYVESDIVTQAKNMLDQHLAGKPGEYQSAWQSYLNDTINKILNREEFSYDLNGDPLYQQYKDQFVTLGKMASDDVMGQAAAMTGGYGNSYAQTVGQQTYQGYLQQLNDKVPELYKLALDQYNREGDELYNQYGLFADRENQDYGRHRDTVADWKDDRSYLADEARYQSETDYNRHINDRDFAYGQHRDSVADWQYELGRADQDYWNQFNRDYGMYSDNRAFDYGVFSDDWTRNYQAGRDAVADEQWKATFDEGVRQFNEAQKNSSGNNNTSNEDPDNTSDEDTNTTPMSYSEIVSAADQLVATGESRAVIAGAIAEQYRAGNITKSQYDTLMAIYVRPSTTSGGHYTY